MLRGYNCTEVIKNEKGVNEARNKTKTGGNEGMKKERKKVLLVWVMTLAMLFGVLQPAVGMNEVRAEEGTVSEQNEIRSTSKGTDENKCNCKFLSGFGSMGRRKRITCI